MILLLKGDAKMKWKKIVVVGLVTGMVSNLWGMLTCQWLFKWVYFLEPVAICNTAMLKARTPWLLAMGILKIFIALLTTLGYGFLSKALPGKGMAKGLTYGFFIWLLGFLPSRLLLAMSTTMASGLIFYWIINDLVSYILLGACLGILYKE
ncbi:MAG: hypothetical protein A2Y00_03695 [Omnitrophica WOR_2 bacterium GWF2_43_52]|nr:MAG: hypothetical protein A2062_00900 [Omnitrophica WOR_2 bacterium GWA2_44_7]OGX22536.1 MAG: hypothetical protein A2Y00_03695 [Omnitrophica WOR_2 bacterium GWF2_43_52]OGX55534.1 MAG: hypothetical protein A2460_04195 [Omnitrophica WOR_2 bacterium RIFOXYC2_FULL_43_9]HBG64625.1 hypothetical protein [Candidatus Omnitrophota bacterium]HCD39141.1 hypothetical protein [Candidatus Omnitrophota bacterium]